MPMRIDLTDTGARRLQATHLDLPLLLALLAVAAFGLVILYSATGTDSGMVERQTIRLAVGFAGLVIAARMPAHYLRSWTPWLYASSLILIALVPLVGSVGKGAQRWLDLGVFRFQPSEFLKLSLPLAIAWLVQDKPLPIRFLPLLGCCTLITVPVLLIVIEPDLGTAVLIAATGVIAVFLAGLRWRLIIALATTAAVAAPAAWLYLHDYQRQRILTFLAPENDPLGRGWNIIQSQIAIGSGGLYGKGWLNGTQSHLDFLPERSTDFIMAVVGEEFGLFGVCALLALYGFIVGRGMYIAIKAQDTFSRIVAGTLSLTFFIYIFVNTGMVAGLLPVVGVPLPLISYGGTSMVTLLVGFGILMSIHTHRRLLER